MIEQLFPGGGGGGGTVDTVQAGTGISVDATDPANPIVSSTVTDTNDAAKVSANDTTAGYLNGKLVAGSNITFTENNDAGNETLTIAAAGGVTGFTGSQNTASPNNTVNASRLLVDATSTNADAVLQPKGTGALLAQLPDGAVSGGNKRGANAVDLQTLRSSSTSVASGIYSVIGGGSNNIASTNFACVHGGQNNSSTSTFAVVSGGASNTASATHATVSGGLSNKASGSYSAVTGGELNEATASRSVSLGGYDNLASGAYSATIGGAYNTSSGYNSYCLGFQAKATQTGQMAHNSGVFAADGDCQYERYILRRATTDATPTILSSNGAAPATATRIVIASDATYTFRAMVTARRTDADNESAGWEVKGVIDNNAGTTALVGSVTVTAIGDDSAGTWTVAVTADNTNDALQFEVTGEAGKTIRWAATVELMKVAG